MAIDKLKTVEQIADQEELNKVLVNILKGINFDIISNDVNFITVERANELGKLTFLFMVVPSHLSGNYEGFSEMLSSLNQKFKESTYDGTFIVSNRNITNGFKEKISKEFQN